MDNSTASLKSRSRYRADKADRWFLSSVISVSTHPNFGKSLIANQDLILSDTDKHLIQNHKVIECVPIGSIRSAQSISLQEAQNSLPEAARYIITVDDHRAFDLRNSWAGLINHAPPKHANLLIVGENIFQIKDIQKNEHLTYDYGIDYWIFQTTHLERSKWDRKERRVWSRIHKTTSDWNVFLNMHLHKLVPFDIMRLVSEYHSELRQKHNELAPSSTTSTAAVRSCYPPPEVQPTPSPPSPTLKYW